MTWAIDVQGLRFRYRGSPRWALKDVDLRVSERETVLVTGPSGSGKSTLIRALNGLIPDFHEGEVRGTVRVLGRDVLALRANQVATFVGTVFQFPEDQIIASEVRRDVAFGLENLGWEREDIDQRVEEALQAVRLLEFGDREVSSLSGGQMQRLALASTIAMGPRVLLFDEPASELDPRGRREFLQAFERLSGTGSHTLLLTDHRLADLLGIVDRLVVLLEGRVAFEGPPEEVMGRPELAGLGVEVPQAIQVWHSLHSVGPDAPCPLTSEEVIDRLLEERRRLLVES
ncbi:MAG: ABC transporter ATP-binding protein [bacterium]